VIIQIILIVSILIVGLNFIGSRKSNRTKALKKIFLVATIPIAILFIIFPNLSTKLANTVGVGRGADLLIYGVTIIIIFQAFDQYVNTAQEQRRTSLLVRKLAIIEAEQKKLASKDTIN